MEKALILIGIEGMREHYQLLIDCSYTSSYFDLRRDLSERNSFYDTLSDKFTDLIIQANRPLEVGMFNGMIIDSVTGKNKKVEKLEDSLASEFGRRIMSKYLAKNPSIPRMSLN
jgi:hypothetical protein